MNFEYKKCARLASETDRTSLELYLQSVWASRAFLYADAVAPDPDDKEVPVSRQPFFRFDGLTVSARNYVGFVQAGDQLIEVYPKVFADAVGITPNKVLEHLFWWFSYCRKIQFPFNQTNLDKLEQNHLPELFIYLFASACLKAVQESPFQTYEELREVLAMPRGRIDFDAYARNGLSRGLHHRLDCIHEPFVYDNRLNRGIKYVCRLLLTKTRFAETQNMLQQTLFVLDDVEDQPCDATIFDSIHINPFFTEYLPIIDWCKRFLNQQLYSHQPYSMPTWSMLLPMEYVFEDFIAGFLERHFSNIWEVKYQMQDKFLTTLPEAFQLKHDIVLRRKGSHEVSFIIDTKYKIRQFLTGDEKHGVSQADMYQMFAYAMRRKCPKVLLIYPNVAPECREKVEFTINHGFTDMGPVEISAIEVPFWSIGLVNDLEKQLLKALKVVLNS